MDEKRFTKKSIIIGVLAGALAYSLFGPVGLILVGLYYVWKFIP